MFAAIRCALNLYDQLGDIAADPSRLSYLGKLNQSPDFRWLGVCLVGNLDCAAHHCGRLHGLDRGCLSNVLAYWFRVGGRAAACPDLLSLPSPKTL